MISLLPAGMQPDARLTIEWTWLEEAMERLIRHLRDVQAMTKLVGDSPTFLKAIAQVPTIAKTGASILISGETGTGKELVARAIHYLSQRTGGPFVAVNCGSLSETLLEDELFGHERGAFTDAHVSRQGLIAQAERGTIFLDEVDALSSKAQVDLLRVLQDKKFRTIGSVAEQDCDIRVVAATNVSFDQLLKSRGFRVDLYYRLCVFSVHLPPLRERKEDISILAAHFLEKHSQPDRRIVGFSPNACAALVSWHWPGNVRELENAVIRGIHLSQGHEIDAGDLDLGFVNPSPAVPHLEGCPSFKSMKRDLIDTFEKDYLTRLMLVHEGNVSRAAREAKKDRRDLSKLMKKHQLDPKRFRSA
jgi:transcriptional regulator with PAS, ATPase and Fis domain